MHLIEKCMREMVGPKEIMKLEGFDLYNESKSKLKKYFTFLDENKDLKELVIFTLDEMKKRKNVFCPEEEIENKVKDGVWLLVENPNVKLKYIIFTCFVLGEINVNFSISTYESDV